MVDHTSKLAEYKSILKTVIEQRPSGMRQRLAEALGKNRSFISQISNPNYNTPIPAKHLETMFKVCVFAPEQRAAFLDAYHLAHPKRALNAKASTNVRQVSISVADLGSSTANAAVDRLLQDMASQLIKTIEAAKTIETAKTIEEA